MDHEILATQRKALRLNLNRSIYGTLAEIGGGQEVARTFFQAGGASGTIAKTISAYDKLFSDKIYNRGKSGRYVSEDRLLKMMRTEYSDVLGLLSEKRDKDTCFFAFADTVSTLNFKKDNEAHGWLGIRYQLKPDTEPNEVVLHVRLLDNDSLRQQQVLGILGVNLIFAAFFYFNTPSTFLQSLMDNLSNEQLEVTMTRMHGNDLSYVDNRLLAVQLIKNKMARAIIFDRKGQVQEPADMLYKKNVLAFRGSFRPITYVGFDMLKTSFSIFKKDKDYEKVNTLSLCEITMNNLLDKGEIDARDFLDRVNMLNGMGQNVMVSSFSAYDKLVSYVTTFSIKNLRIVRGIPSFYNVLDSSYYNDLKGGLLEAMGKLFIENMKVYVYPSLASVPVHDPSGGYDLITSENLPLPDDIQALYKYLIENRKIIDIKNVKKKWLYINSRRVLRMIQENIPGWEDMVPRYVEDQIKSKKLFGYEA